MNVRRLSLVLLAIVGLQACETVSPTSAGAVEALAVAAAVAADDRRQSVDDQRGLDGFDE